MAKVQSFADKMNKANKDFSTHCPTCGESKVPIKLVSSEKTGRDGAWRFRETMVNMCKCNENTII